MLRMVPDGITSELMEESMASFIRHISKRYKQIGRHCMIKFRQKGDFSKLTRFLERAKETVRIGDLDKFGKEGVAALVLRD